MRYQLYIIHYFICLACNCDSIGSRDEDCNRSSGQCNCIENVTGRSCNLCEAGYWGLHTQNLCVECSCCINGTIASQCDDVSINYFFLKHTMGSWGVHCQLSNTTLSLQESGECICREGWSGQGCCSGEVLYDYNSMSL